MARTPLMRYLLRASRDVRGAERAGIPAVEYVARRREALTRRALLQATGAVTAALLLDACRATRSGPREGAAARESDASGRRIAIVGGGLAGLHCAHRLKQLGLGADVYDAAKRTGGRVLTDRTTFGPQSCELGGELIDTPHQTMHDLAAEFREPLLDFDKDDETLAPWVAWIGGRRVSEEEILREFTPVAAAIDEALASLRDAEAGVTYSDTNGAEALDRVSIREWLDAHEVGGALRALIEVAYLTEYGLETDVSSALNFLLMISTDIERFRVFGESDERYRVQNGNDALVGHLARSVGDARIHLGRRLAAIRPATDGATKLVFTRDGTTEEIVADHVVLAIPFTLLREVEIAVELSPVKRRAIAELGYGASAKLMVGFRSRPWREQGSNGEVFTDLPFQCTWETSRQQPGASGIITSFTGGKRALSAREGTTRDAAAAFLDDFDTLFPGARAAADGRAVRMHWPSQPLVKAAYSSYRVGQWTTIAGAEIERAGNLHFAGEHTSLDAQGFMEGAALTGAVAALEIAEDLGIEVESAALARPERRILARAHSTRIHGRWLAAAARGRRAARLALR